MRVIKTAMLLLALLAGGLQASKFSAYKVELRDSLNRPVLAPGGMVADTSALNDSLRAVAARIVGRVDTTRWKADSVKIYQALNDSLLAVTGRIIARLDTTRWKTDSTAIWTELAAKLSVARWLTDSTAIWAALQPSAADSTFLVLDSLPPANKTGDGFRLWGIAGDTTRPGFAYYLSGTNTWTRVDTSVSKSADGLAMDSVAQGQPCRFLIWGTYRLDSWSWTPGAALFSDSVTAGAVGVGGQAAPKKMQRYGKALSATVIKVNIDGTIAY